MRWNTWNVLALAALAAVVGGCAANSRNGASSSSTSSTNDASFWVAPGRNTATTNKGVIVTPAKPSVGRVSLVRASAGYVVVTYTLGQLPFRDSRLHVYRDGLKVAELKVTDLSRDINAVAEVVAGECRVGDEVREN